VLSREFALRLRLFVPIYSERLVFRTPNETLPQIASPSTTLSPHTHRQNSPDIQANFTTSTRSPIRAFDLSPPNNRVNTSANRQASLQRMRDNNSSRGVGGSTTLQESPSARVGTRRGASARGRFNRSGASRGGTSRGRGNARGRTASGGISRGGVSRGGAGGSTLAGHSTPVTTEFLAVLLPFQVGFAVIHPSSQLTPWQLAGDNSPLYTFSLPDVERLLVALRVNNLTCLLSLPTVGEVWRILDEQILSHLSRHGIKAEPSSDFFASGFFTTSMFLIHPKKGGRQVLRREFVESDFTSSIFTVETLESTSRMVSNPESNARHPLLFFGTS
jgi:hypothetical protein